MKRKDITNTIKKMLKKWDKQGFSPESINGGWCEEFAYELKRLCHEKGEAMWGDEYPEHFKTSINVYGHCFYGYKNRYYDSECPKGVDCPDKLPYYIRTKECWKDIKIINGKVKKVA